MKPPPPRPAHLGLTLAALLTLAAAPAGAYRDDLFQPDAEPEKPSSIEEATPWQEGAVGLPPWPRDADLKEFRPDGPATPFRYLIDTRNLDVDTRGQVVRYTLVIEAAGGLRNVSFEGLRCTLRGGYKVYAYGDGGRFVPVPAPDWLPMQRGGREGYREDLWRNRFCVPRETRVKPMPDILRSLAGHGLRNEDTGFQAD